MADKFKFSIPIGWENFAEKLAFAEEQKLGVEIAAFASGPAVFDPAIRRKVARGLGSALKKFPNPRSFHGAYIDINVHSADPAIAAIARDRIERDMELAARLECKTVVFHTGFNPLIPVQRYRDEFLNRHAAFWARLADVWPELTIALENLWEPSPHFFQQLLRAIHHPRVGLCLDVAHAHVYSDFDAGIWLSRMSDQINHLHWNDNHGDTDSHLPLGEGNIPWEKIVFSTNSLKAVTSVVLELNSLDACRRSLRYLQTLEPVPAVNQSPARIQLPEFGQ